ncbi:MAG: caspase family protein [Rubrivivax sp.]|nr:caspase family protein [Rubrivivax sp.]
MNEPAGRRGAGSAPLRRAVRQVGAWLVVLAGMLPAMVAAQVPAQGPSQAPTQSPASRPARVALVIGNAAYPSSPLPNPVQDARDMATLLQANGFHVVRRENASLAEMNLALREFGDLLSRQATGVFYYAGHGVQVRGRNYLIPVSADIAREDEVHYNALDLAAVLDKMDSARNPLNFVILDACRNNPFAARFGVSAPGLAQIDAPPGSLIAFSTAPGKLAIDGLGRERNGLYTKHLLRHLAVPGLQIEDVFKEVRKAVRAESKGAQVPWESTSLEGEFQLRSGPSTANLPSAQRPARQTAVSTAPTAPKPPRNSASATARPETPVGSAPQFRVGDWWTWQVTNELSGTKSPRTVRVLKVGRDEVHVDSGKAGAASQVLDPIGNVVRRQRGDAAERYLPSLPFYQFPMAAGSNWTVKHRKEVEGLPMSESETQVRVLGEEDIDTPAGRFRAVKVERVERWRNVRTGRTGTSTTVYWYSAQVKRYVKLDWSDQTADGRVLNRESTVLVAFNVR